MVVSMSSEVFPVSLFVLVVSTSTAVGDFPSELTALQDGMVLSLLVAKAEALQVVEL